MEKEMPDKIQNIEAISFDKFLSISRLVRNGNQYGKSCYVAEINTDTDKDIFKYPVRIDAYIIVVCSNGLIEVSNDLQHLTVSANSMFLYNPGSIARINALEPSRLSIMIYTREFIDNLGIKFGNIPLQHKIVREKQHFELSEETCGELNDIFTLIRSFMEKSANNPFYHELIKEGIRTFIYRVLYETNEQYQESPVSDVLPSQESNHFVKFMRLLQENYTKQHYIRFYADTMGLSPKYLSMIIKRVSGKLATQWIDEYIILEAKNLIKYSSMSIQEISYTLNFPNQSFFGKYFKRHTGLSPKAYRQQP